MYSIPKLQAALSAASVAQPCTAAAVRALHTAWHAAARELAPPDSGEGRAASFHMARSAVHDACMPVLAWLAAGLRSGLPSAATQQAHEMACELLGVVARVLPFQSLLDLAAALRDSPAAGSARRLEQMRTKEVLCQQLAQVTSALVAVTWPTMTFTSNDPVTIRPTCTTASTTSRTTTTTSSSSSSSSTSSSSRRSKVPSSTSPVIPIQQQVSMASAWLKLSLLLVSFTEAEDAVAAVITRSGLYQALLEGTGLLLAVDPAAYPQTPEVQLQLWDSLTCATRAAINLSYKLIQCAKVEPSDPPPSGICAATSHDTSQHTDAGDSAQAPSIPPWLRPLLHLQLILLAKLQWDMRQGPGHPGFSQHWPSWPSKALTRVSAQLCSPCVAGGLLQQQAPGLVPHTHTCRRQNQAHGRQEAEECMPGLSPDQLGVHLSKLGDGLQMWTSPSHHTDTMGAPELGLLLEAAEMYCLVCPSSDDTCICSQVWFPFVHAMRSFRKPPPTFVVSSGDALVSVAEYLVEDVLLTSSGSGTGPDADSGCSHTSAVLGSSSSSSSTITNRRCHTAGGRNPSVTPQLRLAWASGVVRSLGYILQQDGSGAASGQQLVTANTAPRLSRLLEVILRTPCFLGEDHDFIWPLLLRTLPALHAAVSSPAGPRALLAAAITAAKWQQQVGHAFLAALVDAGGDPERSAAGVLAAVPGPMGRALAQQVVQQPGKVLRKFSRAGFGLAELAQRSMMRAAYLLAPEPRPLAVVFANRLPAGQKDRFWGLEVLIDMKLDERDPWGFRAMLAEEPGYGGIMEQLAAGLALQHTAPAGKQAAKLARAAGGGSAAAKQLRRQLQALWLGAEGREALGGRAGSSEARDAPTGASEQAGHSSSAANAAAGSSCSSSPGAAEAAAEPPSGLQAIYDHAELVAEQNLAACDPPTTVAAARKISAADLRVSAHALLVACKAAGAVAQLPQLLEQLQRVMAGQGWGQALAREAAAAAMLMPQLYNFVKIIADWALVLAPVLGRLLPAAQSAQLQALAAGTVRGDAGPRLEPGTVSCVLGLLGQVVAPGAPGCSYPGCCNLEGRSEVELPVQVCSGCRGVRYCCREHQAAHWKAGHKEVCRAAQAAAKHVQDVAAKGRDQQHEV